MWTSFCSLGEENAACHAPCCCPHTRVLNIKPHMTSTLLTIVPGQVVHPIPDVFWKSAEPRRSGMGSAKRCQAVVRTLEAPHSTYPSTTKHRDHLRCALYSPDTPDALCCCAQSDGARAGCGCGWPDDLEPQSSPGKSGSSVRPAQEADTGQNTHSLGRPEGVRDSRTVV